MVPLHGLHDLTAYLFHLLQIAVVCDAAGEPDIHTVIRFVVVGDDGFREAGIGNDHQVVGARAQAGAAPVHVDHEARHAVLHLDVVAGADHVLGGDIRAGEEVGQRWLERQGNGQTPNAQAGDQRSDIDAQYIHGDHGPHRDHDDQDASSDQRQRPATGAGSIPAVHVLLQPSQGRGADADDQQCPNGDGDQRAYGVDHLADDSDRVQGNDYCEIYAGQNDEGRNRPARS